MDAKTFRQRRVIVLADPCKGAVSCSVRLREALLDGGNGVFWFTPELWPQLFCGHTARLAPLSALVGRWGVDAVVLADGVSLDLSGFMGIVPAVVVFASRKEDLAASLAGTDAKHVRAVWTLPGIEVPEGIPAVEIAAAPDLTRLVLANDIVLGRAVVCVQAATPERVATLSSLEDEMARIAHKLEASGFPRGSAPRGGLACVSGIRCVGEGWPDAWRADMSGSNSAYALGNAAVLVHFGGATPEEEYLAGCVRSLAGCCTVEVPADATGDEVVAIVREELASWEAADKWAAFAAQIEDQSMLAVLSALGATGEAPAEAGEDVAAQAAGADAVAASDEVADVAADGPESADAAAAADDAEVQDPDAEAVDTATATADAEVAEAEDAPAPDAAEAAADPEAGADDDAEDGAGDGAGDVAEDAAEPEPGQAAPADGNEEGAPAADADASGAVQDEGTSDVDDASSFEGSIRAALVQTIPAGDGAPTNPCRVATVLGYVGRGNFGDEYILSTISERVDLRLGGAITVAVSEDPWHTLVHRGIYAVALSGKRVLDAILSRSAAALVMAGLLFDQGIRWTMGKAEVASSVLHSDIPGIAAFAELASANEVPVVLYGIGAGPLERIHSRRLVGMMGKLGARFLCRDEGTAGLISACGVADDLVARRADVAFTGSSPRTDQVDAWLEGEGIDPIRDKVVVVSLREYENVPLDFPARVALACDRALNRYARAHVVFCLLDADDRNISERVIAHMGYKSRVHLFSSGDNVEAMADLLGRASCGLSMRYHCSLLLFRGGVPCVGLGYLPKVSSLYEEAGMGESLLSMDASGEDMARALLGAMAFGPQMREGLERGVAGLRGLAQASEDELVDIMGRSRAARDADASACELYLYSAAASDRMLEDERARREAAERELEATRRELEAARARVSELEQSNSYKIGTALTYLPGLLKHRGEKRE